MWVHKVVFRQVKRVTQVSEWARKEHKEKGEKIIGILFLLRLLTAFPCVLTFFLFCQHYTDHLNLLGSIWRSMRKWQ